MIRAIIFMFLGYLAYRLAKSWLRSFVAPDHDTDEQNPQEAELIQDPQCGTYFLRQRGVPARIDGATLFFCSEGCRDKYLRKI